MEEKTAPWRGKVIPFREKHFSPVLCGEKKITIRKFDQSKHRLAFGEVFAGSFGDGTVILLRATATTRVERFDHLEDAVAQEDGHQNTEEFIRHFTREFNPYLKRGDAAAIIRFELIILPGSDDPIFV